MGQARSSCLSTCSFSFATSVFDSDCEVFFVFNGTAANSLALAALCQSYHSVICHRHAHIEEDECGAPEFFSNGSKLLLGAGENGKLAAEEVRRLITQRTDLHYPKPKAVSITQSTECGTVYTPDEVAALHAITAAHGLHLHMDGARFANAVAGVGCTPAELSWKAGVEVLSFGGTKMGLPGSEALVFFNKSLATDFEYRCKQAGQLASKMRFLSAPWVGLLHDGAWLRHSAHANAMAQLEQLRQEKETALAAAKAEAEQREAEIRDEAEKAADAAAAEKFQQLDIRQAV